MQINYKKRNVFEDDCKGMVETLKKSGVPTIICGDVDENLYIKFFEENDLIPDNVYDRSVELRGKKCAFGRIINAQDIDDLYEEYNAVIVVPYFDEIKSVLMKTKAVLKNAFFLDIAKLHSHPTMFQGGAEVYIKEHEAEFKEMYDGFADKESKQVWNDLVNYWISGDYKLVEKYKGRQGVQYLDFFENYTDHETFLNCGSFDARYSKKFIDIVGREYIKIINIECDEKNFEVTCNNMRGYPNIENVKVGLYNEKTTLHFNSMGNGMSCIEDDGNVSVEVDTIDNIANGDSITFIKMDIEGAEYCALEGAKTIIQANRPKMAICIYHNISDFIRIPSLIREMDANYKFAVRHYTDTLTETVLFAWV